MYISYGIGCETANHQDQWVKIYVEKTAWKKEVYPVCLTWLNTDLSSKNC